MANGSELLGTDGFRGAFADPEAVYAELKSICLEWMMEGGAFTNLSQPRAMCESEEYASHLTPSRYPGRLHLAASASTFISACAARPPVIQPQSPPVLPGTTAGVR